MIALGYLPDIKSFEMTSAIFSCGSLGSVQQRKRKSWS